MSQQKLQPYSNLMDLNPATRGSSTERENAKRRKKGKVNKVSGFELFNFPWL